MLQIVTLKSLLAPLDSPNDKQMLIFFNLKWSTAPPSAGGLAQCARQRTPSTPLNEETKTYQAT